MLAIWDPQSHQAPGLVKDTVSESQVEEIEEEHGCQPLAYETCIKSHMHKRTFLGIQGTTSYIFGLVWFHYLQGPEQMKGIAG